MGENLKNRVADRVHKEAETEPVEAPDVPEPEPNTPDDEAAQAPAEPVEHRVRLYDPEAVAAVEVAPTVAPLPVHVALANVMAEVRGVAKRERHDSPGAKFMFRGIDSVVNAVGPALRNHGVLVLPELQEVGYRDVTTSGGKPSREVTVRVRYTFVGPDGSTLAVTVPGEAMDHGDKGTAKAMSVAFRIALLQALALPTDEPDPDAQAYQREAAPADPALAAREWLLTESQQRRLDWIEVRKAFAATYGHPLRDGDAGELRAFGADLFANTEVVLARGRQNGQANGQTNGANGHVPAPVG